jgi:hypothetical protein
LSFLDKERTRRSDVFDDISEKQISLTYINEMINMIGPLRDLVYTYEYSKIIISIQMIILDGEA